MQKAKERLFSGTVGAAGKTYFFDVKEAKTGSKYLTITESSKRKDGKFTRNQIIIFEDHLAKFQDILNESIRFITQT